MVNFTAWSSARRPEQVFTLLETVYHSFDVKAKRLNVFKVETVSFEGWDCVGYVVIDLHPPDKQLSF